MIVGFAQIVHFIIGAIIGSFLNVVSVRVVNNKQFYKGRSECTKCNKTIRWQDNIPMLSFVLLKGRCRHCKAKISYLYPIVELLTGIVFVFIFNLEMDLFQQALFLLLTSLLIVISTVDTLEKAIYQHHLKLLFAMIMIIRAFMVPVKFIDVLYGSLAFGGFLAVLRWVGGKIYKKEAMGIGDVKLAVVLGLMLSLKLAIVALYTSFISASIVGAYLIVSKGKSKKILPFAPFLSFGAMMAYFYGQQIISFVVQF